MTQRLEAILDVLKMALSRIYSQTVPKNIFIDGYYSKLMHINLRNWNHLNVRRASCQSQRRLLMLMVCERGFEQPVCVQGY